MSSYLQRMAAGVLSRERAIHPIVGSLWAPRHDADSIKAPGEALAIGEDPHLHRAQTPEPDRAQQKDSLPQRASAQPPAALQASALVPGIAEKAVLPLHPLPSLAVQQNAPFSSDPRVAQDESEAATQSEAPHSQRQRIFTPLIQSRIPETLQQSVASLRVAAPAQAGPRADAVRHLPQARTPAREPDAIEIHIGRIEVLTAPQQQEKRTPARAPQKSLDLGEYLRRGGRAR
jgi:hypothetical protein